MFKIKNKSKEILTAMGIMFGPFILTCILFYACLNINDDAGKLANDIESILSVATLLSLLLFYIVNIYVAWHYVHQDLKFKDKTPVYRKVLAGISILIVFAGIVILCGFDSSIYGC